MTNWSRIVMNRETEKLIKSLPFSQLDALEISGNYWQQFGFKTYQVLNFPEFDICSDTNWNEYDIIIAEQVFEHLLFPYRAGKNIFEHLKANGYFLITVPFLVKLHDMPNDCTRWSQTGLKYFLHECGFSLEKIQTGSWGNRFCIIANLNRRGWIKYIPMIHPLKNELDFPYCVWALAQK